MISSKAPATPNGITRDQCGNLLPNLSIIQQSLVAGHVDSDTGDRGAVSFPLTLHAPIAMEIPIMIAGVKPQKSGLGILFGGVPLGQVWLIPKLEKLKKLPSSSLVCCAEMDHYWMHLPTTGSLLWLPLALALTRCDHPDWQSDGCLWPWP